MISIFRKKSVSANDTRVSKESIVKNCEFKGNNRIDAFCECINVSIGKYSTVSTGCVLRGPLSIGRFSQLGPGVKVFTRDHPFNTASIYVNKNLFGGRRKKLQETKNVEIGNDVWIGANAIITKGVNIGDGAIIGAGSLVLEDVPPFAIVGGVPANLIKYRFNNEVIEFLKALKWWSYDANQLEGVEELMSLDLNTDYESFRKIHNQLMVK